MNFPAKHNNIIKISQNHLKKNCTPMLLWPKQRYAEVDSQNTNFKTKYQWIQITRHTW